MPHPCESTLFSKSARVWGWGAPVVLLLAGCGDAGGPRDIQETRRVRGDAAGVVRASDSAHRFGYETQIQAGTSQAGGALEWQLPPGWRELPPTPMRTANFDVVPDVECYLTVLPGGGGGLAANLNRWRRQMSLPPHTDTEITALPERNVLGGDAHYVEYEGTYVGMDGSVQRPRFLLVGIALEHAGQGIFLKMVGPADVVRGQIAAFDALCASLRMNSDDAAAHAGLQSDGAESTDGRASARADVGIPSTDSAGLDWTAPLGWNRGPTSPMRLISFTIGKATECYVTVLEGAAGGLEANVNRWRQQMGQPPLDAVALAALPAVPMLGSTGRLVQIRGDFTGMDGVTRDGFMLIGALCEMRGQSVFVKMTGPEAEVRTELSRFEAFCRSLHQEH